MVLVLPNTAEDKALTSAERLRSMVEQTPYQTGKDDAADLHCTVSIGVSSLGEDAGNPAELLKKADTALYEAKKAGRNRVVIFQGQAESASSLTAPAQLDPASPAT